jgi:hypothetical protein
MHSYEAAAVTGVYCHRLTARLFRLALLSSSGWRRSLTVMPMDVTVQPMLTAATFCPHICCWLYVPHV